MKKVVIAMSGGVDSAVAAYLLVQGGYDVLGITMQIWQSENPDVVAAKGGCCGMTAAQDARFVCNVLGVPHYVLNFRDVFRKTVIDYFAREYRAGRTPNPCIACNRYVKWQALLDKATELEADFIATGHYSEIVRHDETGRLTILAADNAKDQSYALYNLTQGQLARTLFPVGSLPKDEVRNLAAQKIGLRVAHKPDSQEICFIPDDDHAKFLQEYFGESLAPGDFVNEQGEVLGRHKGIGAYTIGQRKGLGMAFGRPMYVKHIDAASGNIMLADDAALFSRHMTIDDINFMAHDEFAGEVRCFGKIRYSHKAAPCVIRYADGLISCTFDEAQRAITPGQSAVFYDDIGRIICGGTIAAPR
ncbi:MAG: tRNA 2-thiouridine(34) synthase MnmA [Clostridiales bacterium]|nr:tRNA 2-thiouridine(34) synthase MnmA [Clostridiales bacterium]